MLNVSEANYCSDFANGVDTSLVENTTFKSDFAQQIQELYKKKMVLSNVAYVKKSHISKVKTVICFGNGKGPKIVPKFCEYTLPKDTEEEAEKKKLHQMMTIFDTKLKSLQKAGMSLRIGV